MPQPGPSQPGPNSPLYRLIEAGQLAHQAVQVPLLSRGLEAGDDAVLFALGSRAGIAAAELAEQLGIPPEALEPRMRRLIERDLVARQAIGPELLPGLVLTDRGERMRVVLAGNWQQLEAALFDELGRRRTRKLGRRLGRFVDLLRL